MNNNSHIGGSFDDFLAEQRILAECEDIAIKQILADQITSIMQKEKLSKVIMAKRMNTSRSALNRLLDPSNNSVTLNTLQQAASAIGRRLHIEIR